MKATTIFASAALLLATGAAFAADQSEAVFDQGFRSNASAGSSVVTREQVRAEVIAARKAGLLDTNEAYEDIAYMAPRAKSAEVRAQLAARKAAQEHTAH